MHFNLFNFLRVNLPYGIRMNEAGEWYVFNREYKPLGWNTNHSIEFNKYPIFSKFNGMTEELLIELGEGNGVSWDKTGEITSVILYNDKTNPEQGGKHWDKYANKLRLLSTIKIYK